MVDNYDEHHTTVRTVDSVSNRINFDSFSLSTNIAYSFYSFAGNVDIIGCSKNKLIFTLRYLCIQSQRVQVFYFAITNYYYYYCPAERRQTCFLLIWLCFMTCSDLLCHYECASVTPAAITHSQLTSNPCSIILHSWIKTQHFSLSIIIF